MTYFGWLCGLDTAGLSRILAHRPEAAALPRPPRDLAELAARLQLTPLVGMRYVTAAQPVHDVAEAMAAAGGETSVADLAKALDVAADDPDLQAAVDWLTDRAIAWPQDGVLRLVPAMGQLIPRPYGLGGPARSLLDEQTVAQLAPLASRWGVPQEKPKGRLVAVMADWLAVPGNVVGLLRTAPQPVQADLDALAWSGPFTTALHTPSVTWALRHGLLYADRYGTIAEMPGEVGRALRGPEWRPSFAARPPVPISVPVASNLVVRESAAAARTVLEQVGALTAEFARRPVPLLKTGGVGVRELRRLAKAVGCDEGSVRLWLELAAEAGLLDVDDDDLENARLLATTEYDAWLAEEPAVRFAALVLAWPRLAAGPFADAAAEARLPALVDAGEDGDQLLDLVRAQLLRAAAGLPRDEGIATDDGLAPVVSWQMAGVRVPNAVLATLWQEARALGIVAHGALSPLGRALAGPDTHVPDILDIARDMVGQATTTAIFQADLTAVVPGLPGHALATLLDSAADRESRGGALIWRFSSGSVRRAFDAGGTADGLTAQLTAASSSGELPQPLAYLIGDIARQHGRIRVRDVGCVLHGLDERLVTEVLGAKALRRLGLTRLAPTVLAAAAPAAETLAALRAAGYFPAAEQADGGPPAAPDGQPRVAALPMLPGSDRPLMPPLPALAGGAAEVDANALAERLRGAPPGKDPGQVPFGSVDPRGLLFGLPGSPDLPGAPGLAALFAGDRGNPFDDDPVDDDPDPEHARLHRAIEAYADNLGDDDICALATAIEQAEPVRVTYRPPGSRTQQRVVIEALSLRGEHLRGRDLSGGPVGLRLADAERVRPA